MSHPATTTATATTRSNLARRLCTAGHNNIINLIIILTLIGQHNDRILCLHGSTSDITGGSSGGTNNGGGDDNGSCEGEL